MRKWILLTALCTSSAFAAQTNVTLKVPGATLAATLQLPERVSGKVPVVLILPGSGPTDRDGNSAAGPAGTYRKLAAELQARGIASLRVDKRGIGSSKSQDPREEAMTFEQNVDDARAWLEWLAKQPQLGKIALVGHSEGGLVALATTQQKTSASALVLLATPGETLGETIRRQLAQNKANPPALVQEANNILSRLERGEKVAQVSPLLMPLFRPSVQPYLISELRLDPRQLIAKAQLPTLILQGDHDLQVRPDDAKALAKAQPRAQLSLVSGMNHVLVPAPLDLPSNIATYADANLPLDKSLVGELTKFLSKALK